MSLDTVCCEDMKMLLRNHEVFSQDEDYGWVLYWYEVEREDRKFSRLNNYGIKISFCPFCGKNLEENP